MKRLFIVLAVLCLFFDKPVRAQYQMEKLDRGLVAIHQDTYNLVSWRLFGTDPETITFNLYRDGDLIGEAIASSTNYRDNGASANATYTIRPVQGGIEQAVSKTAITWSDQFMEIPLTPPNPGSNENGGYDYSPNDASVGDLDGDGEYEIILKWYPSNAKDNSQSGHTGNTYLEALKLDGTSLWRIDLGQNIRSGAHYTQFLVYDFNGDGRSELVCKTAPGSRDATGNYLSKGPAANDDDGVDYSNANGYILSGPEYLTVYDGLTGEEIHTIDYVPARGSVSSWGDNYGNRVDRFVAGVAYLDGEHPSIIMCRGYYTRIVIAAFDFDGVALSERWVFDTNNDMSFATGKGNHQLSVADVDTDGRQEIIYGALVVDDDGSVQHTQTWGHGDALHVGDFDRDNPGLEIFMPVEYASTDPSEGRPGAALRDAKTGDLLWAEYRNGDIGRGVCANIDERYPGAESWASSGIGLLDSKGNYIGAAPAGINYVIWWDGDLTRELLDGEKLDDWDKGVQSRQYTIYQDGAKSINGTKANPSLQADILGDWREELIYRHFDNDKLLVFTTNFETPHRLPTLMHDPQYRTAVAWQNVGYNQPPHPSFYMGEDNSEYDFLDIVLVGEIDGYDCMGVKDGLAYVDDCGRCVNGSSSLNPCYVVTELEDACQLDGVVEAINPGYYGDGYGNTSNEAGVIVSTNISANSNGQSELYLRYANGGANDRNVAVIVNGEQQINSLELTPTGAWTTWETKQVLLALSSGESLIEFVALSEDGAPNLDQLRAVTDGLSKANCPLVTNTIAHNQTRFDVFPNPSSEEFRLRSGVPVSYSITNSVGQLITSGSCDSNCSFGSDLGSGVYFINVQSTRHSETRKIEKR